MEGMFKKSSTTFPDILLKLSPYKLEKDYEPDDLLIDGEEGSETETPHATKQPKIKKKKMSISKKITPLNTSEDGPNNYVKLQDFEDGKSRSSPLVGSKLKKTYLKTKKKKPKKKKKLVNIDEEAPYNSTYGNDKNYGANENGTLRNTRRLPPLHRDIEDVV